MTQFRVDLHHPYLIGMHVHENQTRVMEMDTKLGHTGGHNDENGESERGGGCSSGSKIESETTVID
jgi:hypothetical protein